MYENIGGKIKGLAFGIFIVEAIAVFISGSLIMVLSYDNGYLIGLLLVILGPIVAWLSSLVLYGFGELIVKVSKIEESLSISSKESKESIEHELYLSK
ncbi:MAG: hypothetical protein E7561_00875 [Ruminococcaceae bacterium]|nr:hypothetical protein [Oscillospiraceae bacterium]